MRMKRITALLAAAMLTTAAAQADWTCPDPACGKTWDDTVTVCNECGYEAPMHGLSVPVVGSDFVRLQWYGYASSTEVYYRPQGSNNWLDGGTTKRNSVKLTGLTPGTTYEVMLFNENGGQLSDSFYFPSDTVQTESQMTFGDYIIIEKGLVTVFWNDPNNNGPYTVTYQHKVPDGVKQPNWFTGYGQQGSITADTHITILWLVPGHSYTIRIVDSKGNKLYQQISLPQAALLDDGELTQSVISATAVPTKLTTGADWSEAQTISVLSASEIIANMDTTDYGVAYRVTFPQLTQNHSYEQTLLIKAPNGFIYSSHWQKISYSASHSDHYWSYCVGKNAFEYVYKYNNIIPTGTWTIELYLDGMLANVATFQVVD